MRDFPIFTTENGVGSLVLKEIPYRGVAYITIRDSSAPAEFLNECADFCRAVGAQHVYASGHSILESYPVYTSIVQMSASTEFIPETDAALFPVTEKTVSRWKDIYNERIPFAGAEGIFVQKNRAHYICSTPGICGGWGWGMG